MFTHLSIDEHLGLPLFSYCEYCCYEHRYKTSLQDSAFNILVIYPDWNCWIIWYLYFNFLRQNHTVFHRSYNTLHSYKQCTIVSIFPQSPTLLFFFFWLLAILTGVKWYFIVVLSSISTMIRDIVHHFPIYIPSLEKYLFQCFAHFKLHCFLLLSCRCSLYILDINPLSEICFANISSIL